MLFNLSLGRILGTVTGMALSGPGGAVLGGLAGSLVDAVLPSVSESVGETLGEVGAEMLTVGAESVQARLAGGEFQPLGSDLQLALHNAFCEALYDIGGKKCFENEWKSERDVPGEVVYPRTPEGHHLWRNQNELAKQICACLNNMVKAAKDGTLFSSADKPEAQVQTYLDADTLAQVQSALFRQTLVPYFKSLWELPGFQQHLHRYLVPRLLVHLSHFFKQRTRVWREFNRLMLEQLQAQVQTIANSQQQVEPKLSQIVERLDAILAQDNNAQALTDWADGLADLLAATGRIEKLLDEKLDDVLTRVVEGNREVVERLESLTVAIGEVRAGVHRTEFKVTQVGADVTVVRELVEKMVSLLQAGRGWQPIASNANIVVAERVRLVQVPLITRFDWFFNYYARCFAGREQELTTIRTFLQEQSSGYIFVTGLSGYGKTTLLVNLIHRARGRYCYYFFNRQRGTSKRRDFLHTMCEQLLAYYQIEGELPSNVSQLEVLYKQLLRMPLVRQNRPLILVIDGLDEVEKGVIRDLIPAQLGEGKYVIFSARATGQDWIGSLRLPPHEVKTIELQAFDAAGIQTLLRAAGAEALAYDELFIREALRISQGDPFYLRFLAEDITAGKITRGNITQQPVGLTNLLEQWWDEITDEMWKSDAEALVATLAVAVAPLPSTDLLALCGQPKWKRDKLIKQGLGRFVVFDSASYTLCHPRFQEYIVQHALADIINTYRESLLAYCAAWQTNQSEYARRYYASQLAEAERWDELHHLVATGDANQPFAEARYAAEGSYAGYLEDLQLAWAHADEMESANGAEAIGKQIRYALIKSSIHSIAANIPPELLVAAVEKGVWTATQGLAHARLIPDEKQRTETLRMLAPHLPADLLGEALEMARAIGKDEYRAEALTSLTPHLPDKLLREALEVARAIGDDSYRATGLIELAGQLPMPLREHVLREALEAIRCITDDWKWQSSLASFALQLATLPLPALYQLWCETLRILAERKREKLLSDLAALVPVIVALGGEEAVKEIVQAVQDVGRWWS